VVRQGPAQARQADKMSKNREAMPPLLASDGWMTGQGTFGRPKSVFWTIPHWYQSNGLPSPTLIFLEDRSVGRVVNNIDFISQQGYYALRGETG